MKPAPLFAAVTFVGCVVATLLGGVTATHAATVLFAEDFDGLPLGPPVDETSWPFPEAFTHDPPPGWFRDASDVPGVNDPNVGVFEWEGWSFADKQFWQTVTRPTPTLPTGRDRFTLGQGVVAVADPDRWNDRGNPANRFGFYNTLLATPPIPLDLAAPDEDRLTLVFDTSWRPSCCGSGAEFDPEGDNQTAVIYANVDGQRIELLRWESAPFIDTATGRPSLEPINPQGVPNVPNAAFQPNLPDDRIAVDLSGLLPQLALGVGDSEGSDPLFSSGGGDVSLEFEMEGAGDGGWWAIDNVELASYTTLLGDMDLSGALDAADFGAFAQGMLDEEDYRFTYYGEFPGTRGSPDSTFDFDDVPWFRGVMEGAGFASAASQIAAAFAPIPEPTTFALVAVAAAGARSIRRGRGR